VTSAILHNQFPYLTQQNKSFIDIGKATIYCSFSKLIGELINEERLDLPFLDPALTQHILSQRPRTRAHHLRAFYFIFNIFFNTNEVPGTLLGTIGKTNE
jgi:hypothetical protein